MGLAVAGTAIAIEAAPIILAGAVLGATAYDVKSASEWSLVNNLERSL